MRNTIQYRILQGLHQQISGTLAQEALDANEDVVLAGEMLGQLFLILSHSAIWKLSFLSKKTQTQTFLNSFLTSFSGKEMAKLKTVL